MLLPLSSAPCALLVPNEKDSSESLWQCDTKWTLMGFNVDSFIECLTNFVFWECSNNIECLTCCVLAWIFNLFENIQPFGLPPLLNVQHAVPWHDQSIFFWECSIFWMFNSFSKFWLDEEITCVSHTNFDKQAPKVKWNFNSTNSFSNLYLE